jgi:hypothetical protein
MSAADIVAMCNPSINQRFVEEFQYFCINRGEIRRFMPTPDRFPLFCALVDEAKKYYISLPRLQRRTLKYIPFSYFGREWLLHVRFVYAVRPDELYIDLCSADSKTVLVTVPVLIVESWDTP